MKPICVPCQRFFRPKKNGFAFIEGMPIGQAKPGLAEPHLWEPYKLWIGDKWECPDCHAEIIIGCGYQPISEHYLDDFTDRVKAFGAELKINDC